MFDEGAERSDARTRTDHDDGHGVVLRQAEMVVRLDENRDGVARFHEVRQIGRADALARTPVGQVTDG